MVGEILCLRDLRSMIVLQYFRWPIKVHLHEGMAQIIIPRLEISIANGTKYSIMVKNHTIMDVKAKDQVLTNFITIQSLKQLRGDL